MKFLLLENRIRVNFDQNLPGEGLLVWRVNLDGIMTNRLDPGLLLIQADGKRNLNDPRDLYEGDLGDLFPGHSNISSLNDSNPVISTSFLPIRSGVFLTEIKQDKYSKEINFDLEINP